MSDIISRENAKQQISEWATLITKPTLLDKDATMVVLDLLQSAEAPKPKWDLISRADAIRWVKTECNPYGKPTLDYDSGLKVIEHLAKMPSALPSVENSNQKTQNLNQETQKSNGDLIYRADAIERFCEFGTSLERQGKTMITMVDAKYAFIKTLESLPSAEPKTKCIAQIKIDVEEIVRRIKEEYDITDGWIPCSERLPSEDGRYLVTYPLLRWQNNWINLMHYGKPSMPNCEVKGKCFYVSDDEWGDVVYDNILAWMPLPKPYKGGGE